jgi:hypothetical protein
MIATFTMDDFRVAVIRFQPTMMQDSTEQAKRMENVEEQESDML